MSTSFIRFPVTHDWTCPCGKYRITAYRTYPMGLDDADPDWGRGDTEYEFDPADPCYEKYRIVDMDRGEWLMLPKNKEL